MDRNVLMLIVLLSNAGIVVAGEQPSVEQAIETYRSAIVAVESGTSTRGIESAFFALASLGDVLMHVNEDRNTVLESLSEPEYQRLQRNVPGVVVQRDEAVFVKPDVEYFARLADAKGDDADRRFFNALKVTYPDSVWPVYVEQQTDYSGCTRFGSSSLVETYRAWSDFRSKFPDRYAAPAKREVDVVLKELLSTCACGDAAGIVRELEQFQSRFPMSPIRSKIDTRLEDLRNRRPDVRLNCISG